MIKPIFYYSVMTSNRGDMAIRKSIVDEISSRIDVPIAFFHTKYDELTENRILKQLNKECSALIIAGSGLYTNYPCSSGWYFPCKTELFDKIKVPIFLLGIGCNNNLGNDIFGGGLKEETKKSIKLINDLAKISTVRDKRTHNVLKDIGVKKHHLMLDPANFLKIPEAQGVSRKRVAINVAQHSPQLGRWDGDGGIREKNVNNFTKICQYLISKDIDVVFIAHDALEDSVIRDLRKNVPLLKYLNTDNIDEMLAEYNKCSFSIAMKMHSNIMSFASLTPFISVYYDVKSPEYINMLALNEDIGISVFEDYTDWVIERIDYFLKNEIKLTKKVLDKKLKEQKNFESLMDKVCCIIKTTV